MFGATYFGQVNFGGAPNVGKYSYFIKKTLVYRLTTQVLYTITKSLGYRVTTNYDYKYIPQGTVYPKAKY